MTERLVTLLKIMICYDEGTLKTVDGFNSTPTYSPSSEHIHQISYMIHGGGAKHLT